MADKEARRYAVVTGANRGIGFGICKLLASKGITVVLTARDEKRGLEAIDKLRDQFGLSGNVVFHQLDLTDPTSVAALVEFIQTQFGKLDILINNAGVMASNVNEEVLNNLIQAFAQDGVPPEDISQAMLDVALGKHGEDKQIQWSKFRTETNETVEEGVNINYYGSKRVTEAFIPLLQLSDSPRIVNVSSSAGKLQNVPDGWVKELLSDIRNLTEEKLDEILNEFLKDFKEGRLESKGWPRLYSAYTVTKACLTAYTRLIATKYPHFRINALCPGFVKTELSCYVGSISVEEGADSVVRLALIPNDGPTGLFFFRSQVSPF